MTDSTEVQIYTPIGESGQLSGFDEQLLEFASKRMSGEQMYEELGCPPSMTPARCIQRVREIVRAQDYLSAHDQKALLLLDFVKLRDTLWERVNGTETKITKEGEPIEVIAGVGWANALVRVLREWRTTIKEMSDDVEGGESFLRKGQADLMMAAISVMFDRYNGKLESYGVELPDNKILNEIFEEIMPIGFQQIAPGVAK